MKKLIVLLTLMLVWAAPAWAGGPIVLMGIDAEDGGPGAHGPIATYVSVVNDILSKVTNGGSGILVIGGGKLSTDHVTSFWNSIDSSIAAHSVTYVNGVSAITGQSFSGFAMIAVVSDVFNTASGGLTQAELDALNGRASAVASFVNGGGGLLGFSQCDLLNKYGYLGGIGAFACGSVDYDNITPTPDGTAIGITDGVPPAGLDVCCWHDTYTTFPSFLKVLATATSLAGTPISPANQAAAIGGADVVIPGFVLTPATDTNPVGTAHTVTITVTQTVGGVSSPVSGVTVSFSVTGANTASGSCVTDSSGQCSFTYTGTNTGNDTITATATVASQPQTASASKTWVLTITTVAGTGTAGFNGDFIPSTTTPRAAIDAELNFPFGVVAGGSFCIADRNNHRVRCVDNSGNISTVAGTGVPGFNGDVDGAGLPRLPTQAQLNSPTGLAFDGLGRLLIVDSGNHIIRRLNAGMTTISTVAGTPMTPGFAGDGGPATSARFLFPRAIAVATDGDLIIADTNNGRVRRVDDATQNIDTIAGTGVPRLSGFPPLNGDGFPAINADLNSPIAVAVDGLNILVADAGNHRIRKFTIGGNIVTVAGSDTIPIMEDPDGVPATGDEFQTGLTGAGGFAGDGGLAIAALLDSPSGLAVEGGNTYIADLANNRIRKVDGSTGIITTIAGTGTAGFAGDGGPATAAQLDGPMSVAAGSGELFIVDLGNQRVRLILLEGASE